MSGTGARVIMALMLAISMVALTLPVPASGSTSSVHHRMSCCEHSAVKPVSSHCGSQPATPQDEHCCTACTLGLSFILPSGNPLVFSSEASDHLAAPAGILLSRVERPPIPPPRA